MKFIRSTSFLLIACACVGIQAQIQHLEPPNWWLGMENPELQLMVHGEDISQYSVSLNTSMATIISIEKTANTNYLFINLEIAKNAVAGNIEIKFENADKKVITHSYPLLKRDITSSKREGFNSSDVMYLLMPDRFANGDPDNDIVKGLQEDKIDRQDKTGRHGGDLKGVLDHLDYIKEMGFSAIWFNPFLENDVARSSYHGYSTTDFYKVDPRYGTNEDFKFLSQKAEEKDLKLIMDMIFNHIGIDHWWMKDPPSADWINFNGKYVSTNHRRTVNQDPHASEYDRTLMLDGWFVRSMPDLNQENPFLAKYLIQNSIWWIEYAGLVGIRMDTYPYPDKYMMAEWNKQVLNEYPNFNIVGEEWSMNPGLISYWQKGQSNLDGYDGMIPSMMDFPLQSALSQSLNEEESWNSGWIKLYEALSNDFLYPDPYNLVIFPDNHDMSRFFMQLGMNKDLYKLGITYILTTRGIPQIFYGSEILMTHTESDHHGHIRKDFPGGWAGDEKNAFTGSGLSKDEKEMQAFFKKLLSWRKENSVIHTGKMIHYAPEKGVYVYSRSNEEKSVLVLLNKSNTKQTLETERFSEIIGQYKKGTDVISGKSFELTEKITIPSLTGLVLELEK
jgi:glycosidase